MEFKQLKSFMAVVECGSFTKAAEKTLSSQPTISTHIKALEEELGTKLIIRDTKNIKVNEKGKELYECALRIMGIKEKLIKSWADEESNSICIGASSIPSAHILPKITGAFRELHPEISMIVHQSDSSRIIEDLENGAYDLGMVGEDFSGGNIICRPIAEDETLLITPNTDEYRSYVESNGAPVLEILKGPIIFREQGSSSQRNAELLLSVLGVNMDKLKVVARIDDQEAIQNFVEQGLGAAFISRMAVQDKLAAGKILAFELNLPQAKRTFYIATLKDASHSPAILKFMDYLKEIG